MEIKDNTPDFYNMRDEFASKAMQVVIMDPRYNYSPLSIQTERAYEIADSMLEARKENKQSD